MHSTTAHCFCFSPTQGNYTLKSSLFIYQMHLFFKMDSEVVACCLHIYNTLLCCSIPQFCVPTSREVFHQIKIPAHMAHKSVCFCWIICKRTEFLMEIPRLKICGFRNCQSHCLISSQSFGRL